jgi:hypothetical protein
MFVSKVLMTLLVIGNGWMGAEWHIGFTVSQRFVAASRLEELLFFNIRLAKF